LILNHLDRHGQPRQRQILAVPQMPPVRDFVFTKDYLVTPLSPFAFERAAVGAVISTTIAGMVSGPRAS